MPFFQKQMESGHQCHAYEPLSLPFEYNQLYNKFKNTKIQAVLLF